MVRNFIQIKHIAKNVLCFLITKSKYTPIVELKTPPCCDISVISLTLRCDICHTVISLTLWYLCDISHITLWYLSHYIVISLTLHCDISHIVISLWYLSHCDISVISLTLHCDISHITLWYLSHCDISVISLTLPSKDSKPFLPIRHVLKNIFSAHSSSALSWPTFYNRNKISARAIQNELVGCVQPVGHMFETVNLLISMVFLFFCRLKEEKNFFMFTMKYT